MSLILLDFDGVLADTLADMLRFAQEACDELGVNHRVARTDLTELEVMSFATLGRACGTPEGLADEFARRCTDKFAEKPSPPAMFDGMGEAVRKLAESHALVVVTGNSQAVVRAFLEQHGLEGYIRAVFGVDMPGSKAEKICLAKERFAGQGGAVFMVGDAVSDIHAARQAGVRSIAVAWGHQSLERLLGAAPDHIARSPTELIEIVQGG